ncbi:MAG: NAD-binding protein [Solirubrobacteraceae bacterium]
MGVEVASIYRKFVSELTVFKSSRSALPHEDEEVAAVAKRILFDDRSRS